MHLRLSSIAMLSFFVANFLLVGTRTAGASTATATINSISANGVGGPLGTVTFTDGDSYSAKVIGSDPYSDLAVVSASGVPFSEYHPLTLVSSCPCAMVGNVQQNTSATARNKPIVFIQTHLLRCGLPKP